MKTFFNKMRDNPEDALFLLAIIHAICVNTIYYDPLLALLVSSAIIFGSILCVRDMHKEYILDRPNFIPYWNRKRWYKTNKEKMWDALNPPKFTKTELDDIEYKELKLVLKARRKVEKTAEYKDFLDYIEFKVATKFSTIILNQPIQIDINIDKWPAMHKVGIVWLGIFLPTRDMDVTVLINWI